MDVLPDFSTLDDDELRKLIDEHVREEEEISYRRRLLHGSTQSPPDRFGFLAAILHTCPVIGALIWG